MTSGHTDSNQSISMDSAGKRKLEELEVHSNFKSDVEMIQFCNLAKTSKCHKGQKKS